MNEDIEKIAERLKYRISETFAEKPPYFVPGEVIGCCPDHDDSFDWYRNHTWKELPWGVACNVLDSAEFGSLDPEAYHYFLPGVLLHIVEILEREFQRMTFNIYSTGEWLTPVYWDFRTPELSKVAAEKLAMFTPLECQVVIEVIEFHHLCILEFRGFVDRDIELRTAEAIWRSRT